jgi:hypothetical protein
MNTTDRRIYFTTAIVAVVVAAGISVLSHFDSLSASKSGGPIITPPVREAQATDQRIESMRMRGPADWLDFERAPTPPDVVRLARANAPL